MAFVQLIEFRTSDVQALQATEEEWARATEGRRTLRRLFTTRDRNDPDRYVMVAFFDSHESAMENSAWPETAAAAARFAELTDGTTAFRDLDVLYDLELPDGRGRASSP